ncbi:hypothetical protein SPOG_04408 [Schizosaccharomyces cryophilus OY26]|uniref:Uncharacterized protein n=1 Tax=Schizosaccharomyces cryophilus (strain OY26 / ATCC MYA-4695 / CBS 11777 / NBRC 106824 / NRRL Y48691) TaxID=653667 RepID=S9VMP0_SCHCR|nr:uncharacterized protein SPOG_04408 [Schizosaccharomyces cryophilus OY26]EPY49238.1 hypothetical protein SPOG_04408 [Schizosaccharomyces cryophilus OY26]
MLPVRLAVNLQRFRQKPFTGSRNISVLAACMYRNVGIRPKLPNAAFNSVVVPRVLSSLLFPKISGSFHTFSTLRKSKKASNKATSATINTLHSDLAWQAMTTQKRFLVYEAANDKKFRTTINAAFLATLTGLDMYRSNEINLQNWNTCSYFEKISRIGSCFVIPLLYLGVAFLIFLPRRTIHSLSTLPARQVELKTGLPGPNNKLYFEKSIVLPRNQVSLLSQSIDKNPMVLKVKGTPFFYLLDANGTFTGGSKNILPCVIPTQHFGSSKK